MAVIALATIFATPPCYVETQALQFDIDRYYETMDPETCEILLHRIIEHNEQCNDSIEILDCG